MKTSPVTEAEILGLYDQGFSIRNVGIQLDIPHQTVYAVLKRNKKTRPKGFRSYTLALL